MNRRISVSVAMAVTVIAMTVTFAITMIVSMRVFDNTVSSVMEKQAFFDKISEVDKFVRANYSGVIDDTYLQNRTARGYVEGLADPYSIYYNQDEYNEMQAIANGEIVNIGLEVTKIVDGYFQVVRVYEDSPAARAGIEEMSYITEVDGVDTSTVATARALQRLLQGSPGTVVGLKLTSPSNYNEEQIVTVQRDNYAKPTVTLTMQEGYAYIRISTITNKSYTEFVSALRSANNLQAKGIVFDVREFDLQNNPADQFDEMSKIIDLICPVGTIIRVEGKNGISTRSTSDAENFVDLPMVVLVNQNTSAAAELFASCLRDLSGAQLVGTTTAGRGTMQNSPQKLSDGSALSITYGRLINADNESFDGVGLVPDVEVQYPSSYTPLFSNYRTDFEGDPQLKRALQLVYTLALQAGLESNTTGDNPFASNEEEALPDSTVTPEPTPTPDQSASTGNAAGSEGADDEGTGGEGTGSEDGDGEAGDG